MKTSIWIKKINRSETIENNCDLNTNHSLLKNLYHYRVIIQALNTISLHQHYKDINHDHKLQMFHILCFIAIIIHLALGNVDKFINSSKYSYISIHNGHGLMMMYDIHIHLDFFNTTTIDSFIYIWATFNINTQKNKLYMCIKFIHVWFL